MTEDKAAASLIEVFKNQPARIHRLLRTPSAPIDENWSEAEVRPLIGQMMEAIESHPQVIRHGQISGLAAPQIGILKRAVMITENFKVETLYFMGNPHYEDAGHGIRESDWEMCLSCPLEAARVERYRSVWVHFRDARGEAVTKKLDGIQGRFAQHYIDFLDGVVFSDLASGENKRIFRSEEEAVEFRRALRAEQAPH